MDGNDPKLACVMFDRPSRIIAGLILVVVCTTRCTPEPPVTDPCEVDPADCVRTYVGSQTCVTCHSNFAPWHNLHGHSQALKLVDGEAPTYPPDIGLEELAPPPGWAWTDIRLVIGGYTKSANLVANSGHVITDGAGGPIVQYVLPYQVSLATGGYGPLASGAVASTPYSYDCFRCHTTGPQSLAENGGVRQENRPGIEGTWAETGVQCEACHGPGSLHVQSPQAGYIFIDSSIEFCGNCHGDPADAATLPVADGFPLGNRQWAEVLASPHDYFACTVCHETHASAVYSDNGLRNACLNCHTDLNMARHSGKVLVQGDYTERLSCQSCHMPPVARNASSTMTLQTRIGDTKMHTMYIDTAPTRFHTLIEPGGDRLRLDVQGKVRMTVDVVCLRCHDGSGSAFTLSLEAAAVIAQGVHAPP